MVRASGSGSGCFCSSALWQVCDDSFPFGQDESQFPGFKLRLGAQSFNQAVQFGDEFESFIVGNIDFDLFVN